MSTEPELTDEEVVHLADAERDAGVPDLEIAAAAHEAKQRLAGTLPSGESEAHPS